MRKITCLVLFLSLPVFLLSCQTTPDRAPGHLPPSEHILFGFPGTDCQILHRRGYVLCHDDDTKVADWASYHLSAGYLVPTVTRTDDFCADPDLSAGARSELSDYRGSGYDRGHLVPAGDMKRSHQVMSESFLLSNMVPQRPGFNRGIWRVLEEKVRMLATEKGDLCVMTGPLYQDAMRQTIGENQVAVPDHFYKILVVMDGGVPREAVAFIIPHVSLPTDELENFIVTIDQVEELSGLDFLNELDDALENALEAESRLSVWFQD